jgi:hypothetical protein
MKAEIWELRLSYSPIELLLGTYESIKEVYIPVLNYSFNYSYDTINVIKSNEDRYKSSSNWFFENVKPILIKTIELNAEQIELYKLAITNGSIDIL